MGEGICENIKKSGMPKYALLGDRSIAALLRGHFPVPRQKILAFHKPAACLRKKVTSKKAQKRRDDDNYQ
jgi:hypothetical protein